MIFPLRTALSIGLLAAAAAAGQAEPRHGWSPFGDLKYEAGFAHFDYVNPDAPVGGKISTLDRSGRGPFDTLNPFILKGTPAAGLQRGMDGPPGEYDIYFESLMARALDTTDNLYGLVAESIDVAEDGQSVTFHLREGARFHDGTPIRADDVVFSFNTLVEDGHPRYELSLRDVVKAEALDPLSVRYTFREGAHTRELPGEVAVLPILSKDYYQTRDFKESTLDPPLGSGPYRIAEVDQGRSITYERDPNYWGWHLPVNQGRYNFEQIEFEYYRDRSIALEAFKAGEYSFRQEFTSKSWATEYTGPPIENGWIKRERLADNDPSGVYGYFLNTRRQKFSDRRVRKALDLAFDFEWTNRNIFYGLYERNDSMFENSEYEAEGKPTGRELAFLKPYKDQLPPEVFGPPYDPPETDGSGNNRRNLRRAAKLLREAGWRVEDGVLQKNGRPFTIEFLQFQPSFSRVTEPYIRNLETLGIQASIRVVDSAQYQSRLDEYDFDVTTATIIPSLPPGPGLRELFGSGAAEAAGTYNLAGVDDPVVDSLIEAVIAARDEKTVKAATRALDRVLMWGHYMVPAWHSGEFFIAYWDKFGRPAEKPAYGRGVLDLWWRDKEKAAELADERGRSQ